MVVKKEVNDVFGSFLTLPFWGVNGKYIERSISLRITTFLLPKIKYFEMVVNAGSEKVAIGKDLSFTTLKGSVQNFPARSHVIFSNFYHITCIFSLNLPGYS